ncbi:GTP cyclohydrolase I FolE [Niabella sp. CC-SYL272]|uniref:GTP cyclohydrolase I FolE n=1 Tax=Niabella agricola TaxID=2891571 RepID=UPI001F41117E|nr:GTP cyclohydrolase I FolE [Niabella agricola]MCF3109439.1 GTP cyclohydrolase I FolE [Niabella agricola]
MEAVIIPEAETFFANTPMRPGAFEQSDTEKISAVEYHFSQILQTLGLDLNDNSLSGTPARVAKMFVKERFSGLNPANKPRISLFENKYGYHRMLIEKDISLYSCCEHHFVPIIGKVHVAYIPGDRVIGLSKINRLVQYYAKRPQVQERLTIQIADGLKAALCHHDVAVVIEADHLCVAARGIRDVQSNTGTSSYSGKFQNENTRAEFLAFIRNK